MQLFIALLDIAITAAIITWSEESTQAAVISIISSTGAVMIGSRMLGTWLWKFENDANKRPL